MYDATNLSDHARILRMVMRDRRRDNQRDAKLLAALRTVDRLAAQRRETLVVRFEPLAGRAYPIHAAKAKPLLDDTAPYNGMAPANMYGD